jgi:hypothetical protein
MMQRRRKKNRPQDGKCLQKCEEKRKGIEITSSAQNPEKCTPTAIL